MNKAKEISFGIIWGALAALLISLFIFVEGQSANPGEDGGEIEINISADSVHFELDKEGNIKSIKIGKDRFEKISGGIKVEDEVLIEKGRIYIDGVELTEDELEKLAVDREEETSRAGFERSWHQGRRVKRTRLATVYTDTEDDIVSFSDIVIERDESVGGDVVSIGGDIRVYGEVNGDVVAVFGDVYLEDCYVRGDVVTPFGDVIRDEYSVVNGDFVTKKFGGHHTAGFGMAMRYNRVEGLTILASMDYADRAGTHPRVELEGGYAFTLKRWEYDFSINHRFFDNWSPYIDVGMFQLAESSDRWILTENENSFAAAILKEDFYDFYWKRGIYGEIGVAYNDELRLGACYTAARITNLERTAEAAIFGGKKKFRENWSTVLDEPAAIAGVDGDLKELELKAEYDIRDFKEDPSSGIFANLVFRKALDSDSGEFEYQATEAEFKYYLPVASDQTLFFRVRGGYSDDDLPLFRRYFIGGIGSLRGYEYKEFEGNRYMLFNADYIWRFFDSSFGAGIFFDTGKAAFSEDRFSSESLKSNIGFAFLIGDDIRINLAQRLDDTGKSPVLSVRGKILF
jgi:outer membrane protein insertion porin family